MIQSLLSGLILVFLHVTQAQKECDLPAITSCSDQGNSGTFPGVPVPLTCSYMNPLPSDLIKEVCGNKAVTKKCPCSCTYKLKCDGKKPPPPPKAGSPGRAPPAGGAPPPLSAPGLPPLPAPAAGGLCFSADSLIETDQGMVTIQDLTTMQSAMVKTIDADDKIAFSPVRMWIHSEAAPGEYFDLVTASGHRLSASRYHVVYEVPCSGGEKMSRFSEDLRPGQCLLVEQDGAMQPSAITSIKVSEKPGRYAFMTQTGTVVVNGVAASNYALTRHETMTHWLMSIVYHIQNILPLGLGDQMHPMGVFVESIDKF